MNSSRIWLHRELTRFAAGLPDAAAVLDAGSGDQVYKAIFARQSYESADFEKVDKAYSPSTYVCDLRSIPVEAGRYDAVVFTQVMEHLPDPAAVLAELHRVMKPGAVLFYSGPLYYEEHEQPYDFYRYTQFGLRHLFSQAGFGVQDLRWLEGYLGTAAHQMRMIRKGIPLAPSRIGGGAGAWLLVVLLALLHLPLKVAASIAQRCDARFRYTEAGHPKNYLLIARKAV